MPGKLVNISFESATATILGIDPARVLIQWALKPTAQDITNVRLYIDRGESPEELQQLSTPVGILPTDLQEFLDISVFLKDLNKHSYYQLRAVEFENGTPVQTFRSSLFTWSGDLDLVAIYIDEEHAFLYEFTSAGMPSMIFIKRRGGLRCPECFDEILKRVTKSNCTVCFGTGKFLGYYAPIDAWMGYQAEPDQVQVAEWGKRQHSQTDIQFTSFPVLRVGDVIYEVKPGKFWRISNARFPEKNRARILQTVRVDEIKRSDVEYKLEIPEDRSRALLAQLEVRRKETEF